MCVTCIGHYIGALFNLSHIYLYIATKDDCVIDSFYVLTSKVRELLIFVLCVIVFIYLFMDWGNSSRLTSVILFIDLGEAHRF